MSNTRWEHMNGSITRRGDMTVFRLCVSLNGKLWGQRIEIATERLRRHPDRYKTILDHMVRDIQGRLS